MNLRNNEGTPSRQLILYIDDSSNRRGAAAHVQVSAFIEGYWSTCNPPTPYDHFSAMNADREIWIDELASRRFAKEKSLLRFLPWNSFIFFVLDRFGFDSCRNRLQVCRHADAGQQLSV